MKRYKRGKYLLYDNTYDRLRVNSQILNGGSMLPNSRMSFFDKEGLLSAKNELEGDATGKYQRNGEIRSAKILLIKQKLQTIKERFAEYQQSMKDGGFQVPTELPENMKIEQLLTEASLDVCVEELSEIDDRLKTYEEAEKKEDDTLVLKYGLRCFGKLRYGKLESIDGQKVTEVGGAMIIDDKRSPYDQLPVSQYRELSKQWLLSKMEDNRKRLVRLQEQAKAEGKPIPQSLGISSPHKITMSSLPPCPQPKMVRTK